VAAQLDAFSRLGLSKHSFEIQRLRPLVLELAEKAGASGITVSDVRLYAVHRNLLTGSERGRALSWMGALMKAAGLVPTDQYRRSEIGRSHGNLHRIYRISSEMRRSA
jgi:hypothetical protein